MSTIQEEKSTFRRNALSIRSELNPLQHMLGPEFVGRHLAGCEAIANARSILTYSPTKDELNPNLFLNYLERQPQLVFPRVADADTLTLHECSLGELEAGYCSILEPTDRHALADRAHIDVVLVPGVAFDHAGHRIGYGKGFYDKLIASLPRDQAAHRPLIIGISWDETLFDSLPYEDHDAVLDAIATPSGLYFISTNPH